QIARRHMYEYGTTPEQLAMVAVKNRGNACFNPRAQYQKAVTVEHVLASKVIADPLHLLDCCPTTDGGAAAILCSKKVAARYTNRPVFVAGSGLRSGAYQQMRDITRFPSDAQAAKDAYEMAGIGPGDVDVAEVHDCFSIAELIHYEDLGFCAKGEGGRMIQEGRTAIGGDVAVNPSGGLLSKGHPLGATGVGQIAEIVWQLRSEATGRQVEGAKVGLTHCAGGFQDTLEMGEVCASTVHLFKR
ncbi:MAG: thiolase family protein, partial [Chloroflexi bacterium]|nr:thiolase family protein [Chloroflexota bacterium]